VDHSRLKTFRIVSEMLSFRKAALVLDLSQPAVTAQIKALEESLGVALFNRARQNIALTKAGETLLLYARKIETLSNEAVAALKPFGAQEEVEIGVGASHTLAVYLLPKLLPPLLKTWPMLRIHILAGSSSEVLEAVTAQRISLGMIEAPAFRPDLKIEAFGEDELSLIVPAKHPWAERQSITPKELVEEPILLREPGSGMRSFVEEYLEKNGVLSGLALEKSLQVKSVKIVPIKSGPILRSLSLVLQEGPEPQGPILQLAKMLRQYSIPAPDCCVSVRKKANHSR